MPDLMMPVVSPLSRQSPQLSNNDGAEKEDFKNGEESVYSVDAQIALESGRDIHYRTCSWQKTAALLFSEYICLAILSFPWSFSILGLVPGILVTIAVAAIVQYTSLLLWRFCMKHPEVRDVCDVGRILFGGSQFGYNFTAVMFILNNTFIQALHCIVGAELLNTLSGSALCTIAFTAITAVLCFLATLPRTLAQLSWLGAFSTIAMGIAIFLAIVFSGVQEHPAGFTGAAPIVTAFPVKGTTYVTAMSAFLNITFTLIGQSMIPTFIAEMRNPRDFPKALWTVTVCAAVVFTLCGTVMYHFIGNQYIVAPAFGSLNPTARKIAFSFAIPTIVYLGSLYSSVSTRFMFFRLFKNSKHRYSNTIIGWSTWAGLIAATWVAAWVIAEVIPFFSDLLSLMSSLFDGWFGFIYWAIVYFTLYPGRSKWNGVLRSGETVFNIGLIVLGFYILIAGTYVSIQSIIDSYAAAAVGSPFTCTSNGI